MGRFINADGYATTGQGLLGNNMFAYCNNNPANSSDPSGCKPEYNGDPAYEWAYDFGWWLKEVFDSYPTEEEHYDRNNNNPDFPDEYDAEYFEGWDDSVSADCHQFTSPNKSNVKYVSPDGKYEVIYDSNGYEVTDPRDVGTYNLISPIIDPIGHFIVDVIPWIMYGNSPDDPTTQEDRLDAFLPG